MLYHKIHQYVKILIDVVTKHPVIKTVSLPYTSKYIHD